MRARLGDLKILRASCVQKLALRGSMPVLMVRSSLRYADATAVMHGLACLALISLLCVASVLCKCWALLCSLVSLQKGGGIQALAEEGLQHSQAKDWGCHISWTAAAAEQEGQEP